MDHTDGDGCDKIFYKEAMALLQKLEAEYYYTDKSMPIKWVAMNCNRIIFMKNNTLHVYTTCGNKIYTKNRKILSWHTSSIILWEYLFRFL